MSDLYPRKRCRIAAHPGELGVVQLDTLTSSVAVLARNKDAQFEIAIAPNRVLGSVSDVTSVKLEVKPYTNRTASALMSATVLSSDSTNFKASITQNEWDGKMADKYQVRFVFAAADTALPMNGADVVNFWLVITANTSDGGKIIWCAGQIVCVETGGETAAADIVTGGGSGSLKIYIGDSGTNPNTLYTNVSEPSLFYDRATSPAVWAYRSGAWHAISGGGSGDMLKSENLDGLANTVTSRANLRADVEGIDAPTFYQNFGDYADTSNGTLPAPTTKRPDTGATHAWVQGNGLTRPEFKLSSGYLYFPWDAVTGVGGVYGCYPSIVLGHRVTRMGARFKFEAGPGGAGERGLFLLIAPTTDGVYDAVHCHIYRHEISLGIWSNADGDNSNPQYAVNFYTQGMGAIAYGVEVSAEVTIVGDTITLSCNGKTITARDPRLVNIGGNVATWECYGTSINATSALHIRSVWAGTVDQELVGDVIPSTGTALAVVEKSRTAVITAAVSGGAVTTLTIVDGGSGYDYAPQIDVRGGGGSGVYRTTSITNGVVTGIGDYGGAYPGTGYTTVPTVVVSPPNRPLAFRTPKSLGNKSGTVLINADHGAQQVIFLTGNTTLGITDGVGSYGALNMRDIVVCIEYASGGYTLNFDSSVQMSAAAAALLPVTLEALKSYRLHFQNLGGYWQLLDLSAPLQRH